MAKKSILFVDDEPNVLQGLERLFYGMRQEWEMYFAGSGAEGLKILERKPIDVVVSDMLMPGMNGAEFLGEVMKRYPHTVRIVLSGQSKREAVLRFVGPAHQFLAKPCDPVLLQETISRSFALRDLLANKELKDLISRMQSLPSLPSLYEALLEQLRGGEPPMQRIGEIISRDMAMTAKILQLANSAYFGLPQEVTNPTEAAMYLGLETVKALVLSMQIFSQFVKPSVEDPSLEDLWKHCWTTATFAKQIAKSERAESKILDECFIAGLLHDVGKLILAGNLPSQYKAVLETAKRKKLAFWQAEQEVLGASHAEVGAYLLGLWGLPGTIVEGVALHHHPERCMAPEFSVSTAVHVASCFEHELHLNESAQPECKLAIEYLGTIGLADRVEPWRSACSETIEKPAETTATTPATGPQPGQN